MCVVGSMLLSGSWKKEAFRLKRFCCEKGEMQREKLFFKITYFLGKVKKFEHIKVHKMEYSMNKKTLKVYKIQKILEK